MKAILTMMHGHPKYNQKKLKDIFSEMVCWSFILFFLFFLIFISNNVHFRFLFLSSFLQCRSRKDSSFRGYRHAPSLSSYASSR